MLRRKSRWGKVRVLRVPLMRRWDLNQTLKEVKVLTQLVSGESIPHRGAARAQALRKECVWHMKGQQRASQTGRITEEHSEGRSYD